MQKILIIILTALCGFTHADESPSETYYKKMELAEAEYRVNLAREIKGADRIVLYIVDFDLLSDLRGDDFSKGNPRSVLIAPYKKKTKILKTKPLTVKERNQITELLSKQIAVKNHMGGALCHYPIHGIRIFKDGKIIHEGTFCWVCGNFSFSYPEGSQWLDATPEMKALFNRLLPIPESEIERFHKAHPAVDPSNSSKDKTK